MSVGLQIGLGVGVRVSNQGSTLAVVDKPNITEFSASIISVAMLTTIIMEAAFFVNCKR